MICSLGQASGQWGETQGSEGVPYGQVFDTRQKKNNQELYAYVHTYAYKCLAYKHSKYKETGKHEIPFDLESSFHKRKK